MAKAKTRYAVVIDGEPGALGLWVPDMPGCTSMGETVESLLLNAQEALRMWAEDALADGETLPAPRSFVEVAKDPEVAAALKEGAATHRKRALREGARCLAARGHRRGGRRAWAHALRVSVQRRAGENRPGGVGTAGAVPP